MSVEIVFETHSVSVDNERGVATGWQDGRLSETGRALAAALGRRRPGREFDAVFTSDLGRAVETAEIAFGRSGIPIHRDRRLRECNYGSWNGMPVARLETERSHRIDDPFPGGESYRDVVRRVRDLLDDLAGEWDGRRIIVIGHSATRWALDHLINGSPLEDLVDAPFAWQEGWRYTLPSSTDDHARWQRDAEEDGRACVVGALIRDPQGRTFVHRRSWDRTLLPGCWDIVGGHVEHGESLTAALAREVHEETGWTLAQIGPLAVVADWEADEVGEERVFREFDFLVAVDGDLNAPRLERPKHIEFRWVGAEDIDSLLENRPSFDTLVRRAMNAALRPGNPAAPTYPHATAFVRGDRARPIEALRRRWDPAMASQIAAHLTCTYPTEADDVETLARRLAQAAPDTSPIRLGVSRLAPFGDPVDGLAFEVDDLDGGYARLRKVILREPFAPTANKTPRITVVHPRTSGLGALAWTKLRGTRLDAELTVDAVAITAFDGRRWSVVQSFKLADRG